VRRRGAGALLPVLGYAVVDLAVGAAREWAGTLFARDRWHRSTAAGACLVAGLLVLYSQVRYPANLARVDYLLQYLLLLAVLAGLGDVFARNGTVSPRAVGCALATLPAWLIAYRYPLAGAGLVVTLILTAAVWEARRATYRFAGLRAGLTGGVLSGVTVLVVNVAGAIAGMGGLVCDATYRAEFVHSGQPDVAAYIVGERINGGALLLFGCAVTGAVLGLAAGIVPHRRPGLRAA
jgi:hypothetical protein